MELEMNYIGKISEKISKIFSNCKIEYINDKIYINNIFSLNKDIIDEFTKLDFVRDYLIHVDKRPNLYICLHFDHVEFINKENIQNIISKYFEEFDNLCFKQSSIKFNTGEMITFENLKKMREDLLKENIITENIKAIPLNDSYGSGYLDINIEYKIELNTKGESK